MNGTASSSSGTSQRAWVGVVLGGLVAGFFDISYAIISWTLHDPPRSPLWVLQSVATGLLGAKSFDGGVPAGLLGLFCHFVIAFGASVTYYLASRKIALLRERPVIAGAIFGILVFLFMNWVVIPLAACPFTIPFTASVLARGFLSHAVLIGIPIALLQKRFSGTR
ncbi:MAG TPA: hypothetical protein VGS22_29605 [Thermoanaerobaculia bacterium]|jgi:hypothetical protein|nr:hypothetical protein [Thermoanaerobaculia bacterium]